MANKNKDLQSSEKAVLSDPLFEDFFTDEAIIDQSSAMIETGGKITNGFSLTIGCPTGADEVEIVLTYEEMKAAIADLEADRTAMPHLYSSNAGGMARELAAQDSDNSNDLNG